MFIINLVFFLIVVNLCTYKTIKLPAVQKAASICGGHRGGRGAGRNGNGCKGRGGKQNREQPESSEPQVFGTSLTDELPCSSFGTLAAEEFLAQVFGTSPTDELP